MAQSKSLLLRVSPELIDRVDAQVTRLQAQHPGLPVTRSSAIRQLVIEGLERAEGGAPQQATAPAKTPAQTAQPTPKASDLAKRYTRLDRVFSRLSWSRKYKAAPDSPAPVASFREDEADKAGAWLRRHSETTKRVIRSAYLYLDAEGQLLAVCEHLR